MRKRSHIPVDQILSGLAQLYPDAKCALNHETPFELLVATILSAQCTDKRVNIITAKLFPKYNTPEQFASLTQAELEEEIRECGLFRNKAKAIIEASRAILGRHHGEVPQTLEELMALPGVGRKTANVVLANAFGKPAIAVDTHVFRVANRLGLANSKDVLKTEQQLMRHIPEELWAPAHHWLIHHGRQVCSARGPKCAECLIRLHCKMGSRAEG